MRYFMLCLSFVIALLVASRVANAQEPITYNLDEYKKDFKTGYTSSEDSTSVQGQVFRPIQESVLFEGYPGVKLVLDGGDDFTQSVVTDLNGEFIFTDVPVGQYVIFAQNPETNAFDSVQVVLSKGVSAESAQSPNSTVFEVPSLKLLFNEERLSILGKTGNTVARDVVATKPYSITSQNAGPGTTNASNGNTRLLADRLRAAGRATDDGAARASNKDSEPVSVGAP